MSFPVTVGLANGEEKVTSTVKHRALGTRGVTPDGRVFYYAQAGAAALEAGDVQQAKVSHGDSVHVAGLTVVNATATGVTTLSVLMATTDVQRDLYADGYITIDTSPGQGMFKVLSHPAGASATNVKFTLYPNDKIRDALTSGTSLAGLRENPYASVIVAPTTITNVSVGVAVSPVAAASFCWLQTYGPGLVNADVAPVAGENLIFPGASAGGVLVQTTVVQDIPAQVIAVATTPGGGADKYSYAMLVIRA